MTSYDHCDHLRPQLTVTATFPTVTTTNPTDVMQITPTAAFFTELNTVIQGIIFTISTV